MTRAAGEGAYYRFVLLRPEGPDPSVQVSLPSVTSILDCLSKPALLGWYAKTTVEAVAELLQQDGLKGATADELKGMLKERRLGPYYLRGKAADRGTNAHDYLENIAKGLLKPDEVLEDKAVDGFTRGVATWWTERGPKALAAEAPLFSLRHGFAGTCDLIYLSGNGRVVMCDLKTSKAVYAEAHLQLAAYKLAWEEMHPDRLIDRMTVLRTDEDGGYEEKTVDADVGLFLALIDVWKWQQEREAERA